MTDLPTAYRPVCKCTDPPPELKAKTYSFKPTATTEQTRTVVVWKTASVFLSEFSRL